MLSYCVHFHINLSYCVKTANITLKLATVYKLCLHAGPAQVQPSSQPVVPAVEMYLGNPDGEDWYITQVAVLPLPQPHLR